MCKIVVNLAYINQSFCSGQVCENGHVFIGPEAGNTDTGYELLFGGHGNSVVEIWDGVAVRLKC